MPGTAIVMLLGMGARQPLQGRCIAQITIGTALGVTCTLEISRQVDSLDHWMPLGSAFSIALIMLFTRVIQRLDGPIAIYAVAVGASAETTDNYITVAMPALSWLLALLFVFLAPLCGWLAERVHFPNPWLLGPVLMTGIFAASGVTAKMFSAALVTLSTLAICVLLAWSPSKTGSISLPTAFLAVASNGTAEMAIIAKTFGIGTPIVTAFHFFRVISTVVAINWVSRLLLRSGWMRQSAQAG